MKKQSKFEVTRDDMRLLNQLWMWKLLTTSLIHLFIYRDRSIDKCYRRLRKLEKEKFIESYSSADRDMTVWQLTDRGYQLVNFEDIELNQGGFRSENPTHDFWVTAIHLGAWVNGKPQCCGIFTEQQLRRYEVDSYPKWVPHIRQHRPDGWIKTDLGKSNDDALIALEVEFSKKAPVNYKDIGRFYSSMIMVNQVIWVVKTRGDAEYIHTHLRSGSNTNANEHSFVLLDNFIENQYQSKICIGKDADKSLAEILKIPKYIVGTSPSHQCFLDVRKYPVNPSTRKIANRADLGLKRYI